MSRAAPIRLSYADYLSLEASSDTKHDFVRGQLYAMAGGSRAHNRIAMQAAGELYIALGATPCRPVGSDQRVLVLEADMACYPDVSIVCGDDEVAPLDPQALVNPTVIVEVLSPSTEAYDRGQKFEALRRLPSLRHYLLLHQDRVQAELFTRRPDGSWTLTFHTEHVPLAEPAVSLDLTKVYLGVDLPHP
jgi:Uma2 family endonuclease